MTPPAARGAASSLARDADAETVAERLDHLAEVAQKCIHCGLCLEECPTYLELGNEMDSPRGRILLMRSLAAGELGMTGTVAKHLDLCLGCRACEAACPSGVRYGELLEHTRAALRDGAVSRALRLPVLRASRPPDAAGRAAGGASERDAQSSAAADEPAAARRRTLSDRLLDLAIYRITPSPTRLRWALRAGRLGAALGLNSLLIRAFPRLEKLFGLLPHGPLPAPRLPRFAAPHGPLRAHAYFFAGCATAAMTPHTVNRAQRVLTHNGCAVHCPRGQRCCGAMHIHGGRIDEARRLAKINVRAFADPGGVTGRVMAGTNEAEAGAPIVTIAAGCGAMLKSYGELLRGDPEFTEAGRAFAARVRDISEFLVELGPLVPTTPVRRRVTMHDACHHVHVQGIRSQPRQLLALIPGLELVESREAAVCCGAAGSYNLTQPETAVRLGMRKLAQLRASGATCAAAGNIGCILHLNTLARTDRDFVVHTIDLLHEAYGLSERGAQ